MAAVNILMSTYKGEKFLHDQIGSILSQTYSDFVLHVRDDQSPDNTFELLEAYARKDPRIHVYRGKNLGPALSFLELLRNSDPSCRYYVFCDQDDVWLPNKLEAMLELSEPKDTGKPLLYACRLELVDDDLSFLGHSIIPRKFGFGNALVQNCMTGCGMAMNRAARDLIVRHAPDEMLMHDWWAYLVVSAFGKVVFDERPLVKYRQHGNNVVGGGRDGRMPWARRWQRFFSSSKTGTFVCTDQASVFKRFFYEKLGGKDKKILDELLRAKKNPLYRLPFSLSGKVWRQSPEDNLILKVLLLWGKF